MLLEITSEKIKDNDFEDCIEKIRKAFFDPGFYKKRTNGNPTFKAILKQWHINTRPDKDDEFLKELQEELNDNKYYQFLDKEISPLELPFIDRYHLFFLRRKWNHPVTDKDELYELYMPTDKNEIDEKRNGSKNYGNFNHFVNVVMAMARLIAFFSDKDVLHTCLRKRKKSNNHPETDDEKSHSETDDKNNKEFQMFDALCGRIKFSEGQEFQKFILMIAAFYHDLGKTVVNHRHGMEGAIILSEHVNSFWIQFQTISRNYYKEFNSEKFRPVRTMQIGASRIS